MSIIGKRFTEYSLAPTVERQRTQYLVVLAKVQYKVTQVFKNRKKPSITFGSIELVLTSQVTMEELKHKIASRKSIKHLIEVMDLEIVSSHGYTNLPEPFTTSSPSNSFELYDYQRDMVDKGKDILSTNKLVIYALEMRLGKSHVSLSTVCELGGKSALFVTPKAAISSVEKDFKEGNYLLDLDIINYESLHKITKQYDYIIIDEFHKLGAFPKPAQKVKILKPLCEKAKGVIFLSGTPTPESYSQIYHALSVSPHSPFSEYRNFYAWSKDYVNEYTIKISGRNATKYDSAKKDKVMEAIQHLFLSYSQEEAGFNHAVEDKIHYVEMTDGQKKAIELVKKNKVLTLQDGGKVIADTPAKELTVIHQLCSGTIKYEKDGLEVRKTFSESKLDYIAEELLGKGMEAGCGLPVAIFYCFIEEGNALRRRFPNSTSDPVEFQRGDYDMLISQVRTVREGVNISRAENIIFYNLGFSYTDYAQARQRHQARDRREQPIAHFIFSRNGIEDEVYKRVSKKKSYTLAYYK